MYRYIYILAVLLFIIKKAFYMKYFTACKNKTINLALFLWLWWQHDAVASMNVAVQIEAWLKRLFSCQGSYNDPLLMTNTTLIITALTNSLSGFVHRSLRCDCCWKPSLFFFVHTPTKLKPLVIILKLWKGKVSCGKSDPFNFPPELKLVKSVCLWNICRKCCRRRGCSLAEAETTSSLF